MDTLRICRECKTPLPVESTGTVCAACQTGTRVQTPSFGPAPAPPLADIARSFPQLDILELLGFGGMGLVYKARQPQLDRMVALKILSPQLVNDPAFAERFSREARALAKLNHPNIVGVYDFGRAGEFYYFLMEYVDGVNLHTLIQDKQIKPEEAFRIMVEICNALQFAHDEGVIHRDIKPANILIDKKGRVKLADFGLARLGGPAKKADHSTQTNVILGSPHYMAPEQVEHPLEVDHRADLYSLGVVFYEMLTGELPIGRFSPPSEKSKVDARLDEVVLRALEKEPQRRYQQAKQIRSAVESLCGTQAMPANLQRLMGFEYRSKAALFGLPLLHVAYGFDPMTGKRRVARGVIAIGAIARGVLAIGGVASGFFAFGGISVGVVAGGLAGFGVVSFGVLALGLLFGYGGLAGASVAIGGAAFGYYAHGGAAWGAHVFSAARTDQVAVDFFTPFAKPWLIWLALGVSFLPAMLASIIPVFTPHKENRKSVFLHQLGIMAGAALIAVVFYLFISSQLSPAKMSRFPNGAMEDFLRGPEGPALGKPFISALSLKKNQIQEVNKLIRESERNFVVLERQHSESSTDTNGHVHLTIAPFPEDVTNLMNQMWTDLGGILDADQIAKAHTLHFEKFFPHTGRSGKKIELWTENGEEHFSETFDPADPEPRAKRAYPKGIPPRLRAYLQKDKASKPPPVTNP